MPIYNVYFLYKSSVKMRTNVTTIWTWPLMKTQTIFDIMCIIQYYSADHLCSFVGVNPSVQTVHIKTQNRKPNVFFLFCKSIIWLTVFLWIALFLMAFWVYFQLQTVLHRLLELLHHFNILSNKFVSYCVQNKYCVKSCCC